MSNVKKREQRMTLYKASVSYEVLFAVHEGLDPGPDAKCALQADIDEHRMWHFLHDPPPIKTSAIESPDDIPTSLKGSLAWLIPEDHSWHNMQVEKIVESQ